MRPITLRVEVDVDHDLLVRGTASQANYIEEQVHRELASKLVDKLVSMMKIHRYENNSNYKTTFLGEVIAMTWEDYAANYGTHNDRRLGIADGTMAMMQNGNWKIVQGPSQPSFPTHHTKPSKPAVPVKPKVFDPSEYLKQRVSELQNDANK